MNSPRRARIGRAFSAARDYDRHAAVQRRVARDLAARIGAIGLPPAPRILEIGCGTGFLTEALARQGIGGEWLVTDLSPAMVERCRTRMGDRPGLAFAVLDGEHGDLPQGPFDLVCASLAMQWFDDLAGAVQRLCSVLAPGGHLVFTTLGAGTFAEWRTAHSALGLAAGTPEFLPVDALRGICPALQAAPHRVETIRETFPDARAFLSAVKAIGAGTAAAPHRPLAPAELRRVMAQFDCAGAAASYEVVTCHYRGKA